MLRKLRKDTLKINEEKEFEEFFDNKKWVKFYMENHYKDNNMFKYLLFLRMKGANINKFMDDYSKEIKSDLKKISKNTD